LTNHHSASSILGRELFLVEVQVINSQSGLEIAETAIAKSFYRPWLNVHAGFQSDFISRLRADIQSDVFLFEFR
jgi:hypothetical protein